MLLFSLSKEKNSASKKGTPQYRIYLADINDVDIENWPAPQDATIKGNVLKQGKKWCFLDADNALINPTVTPGESPFDGQLTLTPIFEGITKKSLQYAYDNVGNDFVVVWVRCSDNQKFIAGSKCNGGLRLSYTNIGRLEGGLDGIALQLQGKNCPEPYYFYDVQAADFPIEEDEVVEP